MLEAWEWLIEGMKWMTVSIKGNLLETMLLSLHNMMHGGTVVGQCVTNLSYYNCASVACDTEIRDGL